MPIDHYSTYTKSEFVCSLVAAITGVDVQTLPEEESNNLAQNCIVFFIDYIVDYIEKNYNLKDAIRIRTMYETGDDLFLHFPDLKEKYSRAYNSFVAYIQTQNKLNNVGNGKEKLIK